MVCCFKHGTAITSQPHAHARWTHRSSDLNGRSRKPVCVHRPGANRLSRDADLRSPIGNEPGWTNACEYLSAPGAAGAEEKRWRHFEDSCLDSSTVMRGPI